MSSNRKKDGLFGRDEMTALLGGGLSEQLVRPTATSATAASSNRKRDVSDLTAAETAAMLQQSTKAVQQPRQRHRTNKVRDYHKLVLLEPKQQHPAAPRQKEEEEDDDDSTDQERDNNNSLRTKPAAVTKRRRRDSASSSSSSSSSSEPRRRRRHDHHSSSSSSEDDDRRQRLVLQRRKQQPTVEQQPTQPVMDSEPSIREPQPSTTATSPTVATTKTTQQQPDDLPSSSNSSSSDDVSSSDDSESSSDHIAKPVFVPKHLRSSIAAPKDADAEQQAQLQQQQQQKALRRKQESRALVKQVVTASVSTVDYDQPLEGLVARNVAPEDHDDDDDDEHQQTEHWEVRELLRLLADWDAEQARATEERELARRRQLTDEQQWQEDMAAGRYNKAPGQQQQPTYQQQRYFHKGAFYMDESEWEASDIRMRADEYAQAATGSDKVDPRSLPQAMRVKKFGFANQSKYKGLAAEDTTDRQAHMLPLQRRKPKSK